MLVSQNNKSDPEPEIVNVPQETENLFKRLSSPAYLLLHPKQFWKAALFTFIKNILWMAVLAVVVIYLFTELMTFIYMITTYGFVR